MLGMYRNLSDAAKGYEPEDSWDPKTACDHTTNHAACQVLFGSGVGSSTISDPWSTAGSSSGSDPIYVLMSAFELFLLILEIVAGSCGFLTFCALIVCCVRMRNRKKKFRPVAAYYRAGGIPPPSVLMAEPVLLTLRHHPQGQMIPAQVYMPPDIQAVQPLSPSFNPYGRHDGPPPMAP
ncbi:hypothetical protein BKA62DRAFT_305138 [Auriculariales sp. MPI-PUGE-AT-0066]|nr:hypothetical protein BKA62DRAFT_305138 [Auriculariales sp. MPI-PUGE-AT-0066]